MFIFAKNEMKHMATPVSLSSFSRSRKARTEWESNFGGLILLLIMSGAIIAYVLLTTPTEREKFGIIPEKYTRTILDVAPGAVSQGGAGQQMNSAEFSLGSVSIDYSVQKSTQALRPQLAVRSSAATDSTVKMPFDLKQNIASIESAAVEAIVSDKAGSGDLIVFVNGKQIFSEPMATNQKLSIAVPRDLLQASNTIEFSASSPGLKFWQANSYSLLNVNLAISAYDEAKSISTQTFTLAKEQASGLQDAKLKAFIGKTSGGANLKISVNENEFYSGAKTGTFEAEIPATSLKGGANSLKFLVEKGGAYRLSFAKVVIGYSVEPSAAKSFSFFVNDYNANQIAQGALSCTLIARRSSGGNSVNAKVNSQVLHLGFAGDSASADICKYLVRGDNKISLTADEDVSLSSLKLVVVAKQ